MSTTQDYERQLGAIKAIPDKQVVTPNTPVDIYLQEAEDLFHWVQPDREKLIAVGIPGELIDDLPARIGALREAQGRWISEYKIRNDAQAQWTQKSPEAYDFRDAMLHAFRYAYRKHPKLRGLLDYIAEGHSNADMIQDIHNLSEMGKTNPAPLKAIGYDLSLLDKAEQLADDMADLLGKANGDRLGDQEAKLIRDKSFTHLKEAVDELRDCGKYLFWRDEDRLKGYSSQYKRQTRGRSKMKSMETEEEEEMGEVSEP